MYKTHQVTASLKTQAHYVYIWTHQVDGTPQNPGEGDFGYDNIAVHQWWNKGTTSATITINSSTKEN